MQLNLRPRDIHVHSFLCFYFINLICLYVYIFVLADEAASPERLAWRQLHAPGFFWGIYESDRVSPPIGFIVGTRCAGDVLTHDSMGAHDPEGESLAIHSVVVASAFRRRGIARAALRAYAEAVSPSGVKRLLLITHAKLAGLYASAGFTFDGLSAVFMCIQLSLYC